MPSFTCARPRRAPRWCSLSSRAAARRARRGRTTRRASRWSSRRTSPRTNSRPPCTTKT
uniref:Uncharacterized protein n=1 Tax=Human herpesvirus 2 TaxID=10310 RepID=A0A481TD20_HHV2|nr:hypothetical protein [Human alphaherpesvirus 2]